MPTSMQFDKRGLQIQLDICKLVFDGDTDLLVEDRLLKEQICHRMMMLESCLRELELWEKRNDPIRYDQSLDQANKILEGIGGLIEQMLDTEARQSSD